MVGGAIEDHEVECRPLKPLIGLVRIAIGKRLLIRDFRLFPSPFFGERGSPSDRQSEIANLDVP